MKWDTWYQLMLPDEISRLEALRRAILRWADLAHKEFAARWEGQERVADHRTDWGYSPQDDDAFVLRQTERVMFANLAVTIASTVESFVSDICASLGIKFTDGTDYGRKVKALEKKLGIGFRKLPGYEAQRKARLLGNCFKHAGGKTDERYVKAFGGSEGQVIEYEEEDWVGLLRDVEMFLDAMAAEIPEMKVPIDEILQLHQDKRATAKAEPSTPDLFGEADE